MSELTLVQDLLVEARQQEWFTGVLRHLDYQLMPGKALACIGVRRCGKSTFLHQIMGRLRTEGVPAEDFIYLNFFDDRLEPVRQGRLDLITEAYFSLYPEKRGRGGLHCFLDEIQMCSGWEGFVDRLLRVERMGVCFSGSSARLLAHEVGTAMRGRALTWELFPFSFAEFLDARGIDPDLQGQAARLRVRKAFDEYWEKGGFPEVLNADESLRVMIHQDYFKTMIFRDVVDRCDAIHPRAVRDAAYRLLNSTASLYSINAVTGYLKSQGHKISKTFVGEMLDWFEDAYALFSVKLFDASLSRQAVNPKKIYAVDHAMVRSCSTGILVNSGHLLENMVFIDGRRRGRSLFYYRTRNGREVDFVWKDSDGQVTLIQVCEQMPEGSETRERELTALREAQAEQSGCRAVVVTRDEEVMIDAPHGRIEVLPVWKWLLES
jgi:predicted AAA+ superfamily ATPase